MADRSETTGEHALDTDVADFIAKNRLHEDDISWVSPTGIAASANVLTSLPQEHLDIGDSSSGRIADVGCGAGLLTNALTDSYPESTIIGIEYAPSAYRIAQRRFGSRDHTTVIGGDATEVLPEINSFDFVYAINMLQDTKDPVRMLRSLSGSLHTDGVLAVTIPNEEATDIFPEFTHHDDALQLPYMEMEDINIEGKTTTWKQYAFPDERFREIAQDCGLQIVNHEELPADATGLLYPMDVIDDEERKLWADSLVQKQKEDPQKGPSVQLYLMRCKK
jgi:SAM-dependent methyltransferase